MLRPLYLVLVPWPFLPTADTLLAVPKTIVFAFGTTRLLTILKHKDQVDRVAFSPDGRLLASLGRDALKMWSVAEILAKKP